MFSEEKILLLSQLISTLNENTFLLEKAVISKNEKEISEIKNNLLEISKEIEKETFLLKKEIK